MIATVANEHRHEFYDGWPGESYCRCGATLNDELRRNRVYIETRELARISDAANEADLYR